MAIDSDIDLLNDEDEEDKVSLPDAPSLSDLFGSREKAQEGIDNFVPKSYYSEARDRASKYKELLSSNDTRMEPILAEFGKFRDKLDNTAMDTPAEARMPFYADQKIDSPNDFINEVNEQFKTYGENKGESAFLGFGESDASERAKRGLPLRGEWDGLVSKYRALETERTEVEKQANQAFAVRDEMTKRYLDYTDAQREALQDMWDAQHGDEETKASSRSRLSTAAGYDPYAYGSTNEVLGFASKIAKQRRAIHAESNYQAELEREYQTQRQLDKEGLRFSENGYFAGFPMNVSEREAEILKNAKQDLNTAIETHGEENVEKARFSEKFNASLLDLRTAKHDVMIATANKDEGALKEARAAYTLATATMRKNILQAGDMGSLGELLGRPQTQEEMSLLMGIISDISNEKSTKDGNVFDGIYNGVVQAIQQRKQSWSMLKHAFGTTTDEEFVKDQQRLAGEQTLLSQPMGLSDIEGAGDAGKFATEFITTMGTQIMTHTPEGVATGTATNMTGRILEKISKAPLSRRIPLLRSALRMTGKALKSKTGTTIGGTMGTVTSMELGGAYLEAISKLENDLFPNGVDPLNAEAHMALLQDDESIAQVRRAAYGRAATIAAIESATVFAGGIATRTMRKLGSTGRVAPAMARGTVDVGLGMGGEVGGMYVMHNTMGSDSPFVTFQKNAKGEYELGGYLGENLEDVVLEGIGGPMIDATGTAFGKAYEYTAQKMVEHKAKVKQDLTNKNFQDQLASLADEVIEQEKGTASEYRGSAKDIGEVKEHEYGTTGVVDTGRGKQYTYYTAKDNTSLLGMMIDRFGETAVNEKQVQFLEKFFGAMEGAGSKDWRNMKIVFTSEMEAGVEDSPASFDPKNNILAFNTTHLSNFGEVASTGVEITTGKKKDETMSLVANVVHEVGHFTERYMVGEAQVKKMFEGIDANITGKDGEKQGMFLAHLEYDLTERKKAQASDTAWAESRKDFYERYNNDENFANRVKSEWWAFQFSRVAREQTKDMDKGVLSMIKKFFKALREPYKDMVGDKNLSNDEVDLAIAELFGSDSRAEATADSQNNVDPEELARNSADLKRPVEEPVTEEATDAPTEPAKKEDTSAFDQDQEIALPEVKPKKPKAPKKAKSEPKKTTREKPEVAEGQVDEASEEFQKLDKKKNAPLKRILFSTSSTPEQRAMVQRVLEKRASGDKPSRPAQKILAALEEREAPAKKTVTKENPKQTELDFDNAGKVNITKAIEKVAGILPQELKGAKPRYGAREVEFKNDTQKALYIVGSGKESKRKAEYRDWLKSQGVTDIAAKAKAVRDQIKEASKDSEGSIVLGSRKAPRDAENRMERMARAGENRTNRAEWNRVIDEDSPITQVEPPKTEKELPKKEDIQQWLRKGNVNDAKVPEEIRGTKEDRDQKVPREKLIYQNRKTPEKGGVAQNQNVEVRVDIPTFLDSEKQLGKGFYAVTIHDIKRRNFKGAKENMGRVLGFDGSARLKDVTFANERVVTTEKIARGESNKFPMATVNGKYQRDYTVPKDIESWDQVGFDPKRHSYFYKRGDSTDGGHRPILSAQEAFMVGNTVYVKGAVYGDAVNNDLLYARGSQNPRALIGESRERKINTLASRLLPDNLRQKLASVSMNVTEAEVLGEKVWEEYRQKAARRIDDPESRNVRQTLESTPKVSKQQASRRAMEVADQNELLLGARGTVQGAFYSRRVPNIRQLMKEASSNDAEPVSRRVVKIDVQNAQKIADLFEAEKHIEPQEMIRKKLKYPEETIQAYQAMADETVNQYKVLLKHGYKFEMYTEGVEPYANSPEMLDDLIDNKHMWLFPTDSGFGEDAITVEQTALNPLLAWTEFKDVNGQKMRVNDLFRAVHDFFGHGERSNSFGALGEENAWDAHSQMFSPLARRAMTTETRGQNSWVNFGPHIRRSLAEKYVVGLFPQDLMPKKGDRDFTSAWKRPFADQKIFLLPDEVVFQDFADEQVAPDSNAVLGARKGEPDHGVLGNVENGEILYTKNGDLGMMNHSERIGAPPKGNPWRYRESSKTVYYWQGKPSEMDKDAVTIQLEKKGYDTAGLKHVHLNANSPNFEKMYEDAHAFPLMKPSTKKFSDEFGTLGARIKGTSKFPTEKPDHGWLMPDGSFLDASKLMHIVAIRDWAEKHPKHPLAVRMMENVSTMQLEYMKFRKIGRKRAQDAIAYEHAFDAGLVRVVVERRASGKRMYLQGGKINQEQLGKAEMSAILGEFELYYDRGDDIAAGSLKGGSELLYAPPSSPLGARASKNAYLADVDKTLDNFTLEGVKDKNGVTRAVNPIEASSFEGGRVRSLALKLNKMFRGSDRLLPTARPTKKQLDKAGDRILEVLGRAIYEFPKFATWYQKRINMAVQIFTELDPDLNKADNKAALMVTLAITSNGADVKSQTFDGWDIYKGFKKNGTLGSAKSKASRGKAIEQSLKFADELATKLGGYEKLGSFLSRKGTKKELQEELVKMGYSKDKSAKLTNGELATEVVPFSLVFGPKLGSFFNNLNGDFSTTTMDRWFMRTMGRAMGYQIKKVDVDAPTKDYPEGKRKALLDAVEAAREDLSVAPILAVAGVRKNLKDPAKLAALLAKHFTEPANRKGLSEVGNNLRLTANGYHKIADGHKLIEAPEGGTHRSWIRKVMANALEKFNEGRENKLVPAEAQALLWYYEKLVHEAYGSRQKDAAPDYANSANELFKSIRGVDSANFGAGTGIEPRSDGRRSSTFSSDDARAPANGIELDPLSDPLNYNERVLGARPAQVSTRAVVTSKQVFLNDSLSFVERLKQASDIVRVKMQDKMLPVRRLIDVMEQTRGRTFGDDMQAYVKHENYHGKTGAELTNWSEAHERPIAEAVASNQVDVEVLDDYLHLRHAQERNRVIREKTKTATVTYRKNGRIVRKNFAGPKADTNAKQFATGFKVSWQNTFADGSVETKTKEFKEQAKAEAFAKKKIKRSQKPNWPRQGNIKMSKGRLSGRSVQISAENNQGSGYSDEAARAALNLNKKAVYALHAGGSIDINTRDRLVRVIDTLNANPKKKQAYENVAQLVDGMNQLSLSRQYESGLISKKDYTAIKKAYKHWIPLRGWEDVSSYYDHSNMDAQAILNEKILPISQGMSTLQHKFRGATGLQEGTTVHNHLAFAFAAARQGIVESQKNEVMRSFFDLVATAHKDPALKGMAKSMFSYTKGVMKSYVDKSGAVRKNLDPRWKDDPNVVGMKINGQTVALRLAPDRLDGTSSIARALKNLGVEKTGTAVNLVKGYTRFMASMRTTFSPAFTAVNFFRDMQTAAYGITGLDSDFQKAIERGEISADGVKRLKQKAVTNTINIKKMRKAFLGALHHSTGGRGLDAAKYLPLVKQLGAKARKDPEVLKWAKIFKDFSDNGGRINFFGFSSVQDMAKNFNNQVKDFDPDNPASLKDAFEGVKQLMEETSGAVENLARVMLYDTLVTEGVSKQRAANMALNLTTNFTRKGEWTTALNGLYLFFNAGVQGSYKIASTAMKSPAARKFLMGYATLGFVQAMWNRLFSDEDEDGEPAWDRVSPYSKTHNFHFFVPSMGDLHFKMPMPYGVNVFSAGGTLAADVMFGKTKAGDAALTLSATALESFSPIGGSSMASALTPTALQPITDLMLNRDYKGAPIYKENFFNKDLPDSSLYWSSTTDASKATAKFLNKITGGDDQRKGAIDISPDTIDYFANYALGGLGSFLGRSMDAGTKIFGSDAPDPSVNDIPIVRRFVGDKASYFDTDRFYRLVKHTSVSKDRIENYRRNRDPRLPSILAYEKPRLKLHEMYTKQVQKQLSTLRRLIENLEKSDSVTGQVRQDKIQSLKDKRTRIMRKFISTAEKHGVDDF